MAKPTADTKLASKAHVLTNGMFNKAGKETLRERKIPQRVGLGIKFGNVSMGKSIKKSNTQLQAETRTEHPLAAAFSENIEESREHIRNKADAELVAACNALTQRLDESDKHFSQLEQDAIQARGAVTQPFKDQELVWKSAENDQSGKTTIGVRMKKFHKVIQAAEKELIHRYDQYNKVQTELREWLLEMLGPEGAKRVMAGEFDATTFMTEDQRKMRAEIAAEKKMWMDRLEKACKEAMTQMKDSEKLRHKEDMDRMMAMMDGDEY